MTTGVSFRHVFPRRSAVAIAVTVALLTGATVAADAQGTLSTQGFGYPVGALSIRTSATGGAFAEFDALSAINPAALGDLTRPVVTVQSEPELRSLSIGGKSESSRIQRIPLVLAAFPVSHRGALAISASSFLDRTFSTTTTGSAELGDETISTRDSYHVRGSMSDLRAALGFRLSDKIGIGVSGHAIMGVNNVAFSRNFADSVRFGSVMDSSRLEFQGSAVTFGADFRPLKDVALSASYRIGNSLEANSGSATLGKAKVPARLGAALRYEGIRGSVFSLGVERIAWTDMDGLGTATVDTHDANNLYFGAEVAGPQFRQLPVQLRAGFASVQLPFGVNGSGVNERRLAAGIGIPLDPGFGASLDLSIQRATRSLAGNADVRERAWLFGFGLQIRP